MMGDKDAFTRLKPRETWPGSARLKSCPDGRQKSRPFVPQDKRDALRGLNKPALWKCGVSGDGVRSLGRG